MSSKRVIHPRTAFFKVGQMNVPKYCILSHPKNVECSYVMYTLAVLSSEAVMRCLLSEEKSTDRTAPACPFIVTDSPLLLDITEERLCIKLVTSRVCYS